MFRRRRYHFRRRRHYPPFIRFLRRNLPVFVVVVLLLLAGWKLYEPVMDFLTREKPPKENPSKQEEIVAEAPETPAVQQPVTEEKAPEAAPQPPVETVPEVIPQPPAETAPAMKTVYLSKETVLNEEAFSAALSDAKAAGMDSVMFDLKSREGWVIYPISYQEGFDDYYTARDTVSLKETAEKIREAGLKPVASLYTFMDRRYQQSQVYAGILYEGSDMFWLDNSPEAGGKSWLNPYSPLAKDYLKKLMSDAAEAGFEEIVLREFRFPVGAYMEKMRFVYDGGQSKLDCLKAAAEEFRSYGEEIGLTVWIEYPATALLGGDERPYGGACAELLTDNCMVDFSGSDSVAEIVRLSNGAQLGAMIAHEAQSAALRGAGIDRYILIK